MFGRKLRTKLPQLELRAYDNEEIRDRDARAKYIQGQNYNKYHNVTDSDVVVGDHVLVKQHKENKLSTPYRLEPMKIIQKSGNQVVIQSDDGSVIMRRNSGHVRKFIPPTPTVVQDDVISEPESDRKTPEVMESGVTSTSVKHSIIPSRPVRTRNPPVWSKYYVSK